MKKQRREVRNLILMFSSAVFIAFLVVVGLVYYLGSSGTYLLRNVLVSPEVLEKVSFTPSKHDKQEEFVFNKIEFVLADKQGRQWGRFAVSPSSYAAFYKLVAGERSLPHVTDEIIAQFAQMTPSTLTLFVRASDNQGSGSKSGEMIFQVVQFVEGSDVFRVLLRAVDAQESPKEEWVYFHVPGIYSHVIELFAPTTLQTSS